MIKQISSNEIDLVLGAIKDNYGECLYLYLDLVKYGTENPNIKVWVNEIDNNIDFAALKYYTGMHIYVTKDDFDSNSLVELINNEHPTIICAKKSIVEKLQPLLEKIGYMK